MSVGWSKFGWRRERAEFDLRTVPMLGPYGSWERRRAFVKRRTRRKRLNPYQGGIRIHLASKSITRAARVAAAYSWIA
jgi:hypothetical protein